jgi:hypothetical protein
MSKSLQQIIDEQRQISPLSKVSDARISHALTNISRKGDTEFKRNCAIAQQSVWNDPNKNQIKRKTLEDTWANNPDKLVNPRKKEIQVPWGRFESRKIAEEEGKKQGVKRVAQVIREGLENDKDNFFYTNKSKKTMPMEARLRMAETKKKNGGKNCQKFKTPFGIMNTRKETLEIMKLNKVPNPRYALPKLLLDPNSGYEKI